VHRPTFFFSLMKNFWDVNKNQTILALNFDLILGVFVLVESK